MMGEAKRGSSPIEALEKDLVDKGLLIEAGFYGLRMMSIAKDAPQQQVDAMREAFFAGAHHLYRTIIRVMDPGDEPTDDDMRRFALIHEELERFIVAYQAEYLPKTEGRA